jgi:DNA replication protein DnaC
VTEIKQCVNDYNSYQEKINTYKKADCLLIDDMLKGKNTDADINILFEIINHRYLNNLPLIVSSEKTADQLLGFDEAVMSRLIEMSRGHIIEIYGSQYNHRMAEFKRG